MVHAGLGTEKENCTSRPEGLVLVGLGGIFSMWDTWVLLGTLGRLVATWGKLVNNCEGAVHLGEAVPSHGEAVHHGEVAHLVQAG